MTEKKIKPWQGFLVAAIEIVIFILVCTPLQLKLGMTGLILTELIVLSIALLAKLIFGGAKGWRETFSLNKFTAKQLGGSVLLYIGTYFIVSLVAQITAFFFSGMSEVTSGMLEMFTTVSKPVMFLIVAVSPAICEEMLCRGFIAHSLSGIKKEWLQVLLIGILFGIFHLDPYRFLPTAILGAALGYILVKTRSIFLTMIFHFVNNAISTLATFYLQNLQEKTPEIFETAMTMKVTPLTLIGAAGISLGIAVIGLFFGSRILRGYEASAKGFRNSVIAVSASVVLILLGFGINIAGASDMLAPPKGDSIYQISFIAEDFEGRESDGFEVAEDGYYSLSFKYKGDKEITFSIKDVFGKSVYEFSGSEKDETVSVELFAGPYTVNYDIDSENIEFSCIISKADKVIE